MMYYWELFVYRLAMRYLNLADLIAMVETKLRQTKPIDRTIPLDDLNYIIDRYH